MKNYELVLEKTTLLDEQGVLHYDKYIGIEKGKIAYIGEDKVEGKSTVDCREKIVSPSFANGHAHGPMNILKGIAEDANIDDWFNQKIWPYESSLEEKDIYLGTKLAIYEMINNGITSYAEHYFMEEAILEAAHETHMRIDLAPTIFSIDNVDKRIIETLKLKKKYENDPFVVISFGPHSTYMCTEADLEKIAQSANLNQMKVHIHVGETKQQLHEHIRKYNVSPLETLSKTGVLNTHPILAHSLFFTETDLSLLKNQTIVLCPKTYMKLSMDMSHCLNKSRELNIALGTDGGASSNSLNIVEQAECLGLVGKYQLQDATCFDLQELWQTMMKTHNLFEFRTGKLELNSPADLIIWDFKTSINTAVNYDVLANIIYSSHHDNIESVLINGKFVKKNGVVKGLESAFIREVEQRMDRLIKVGAGKTELKF